MKLLWVKTDFLHPTTRGGQIRSLELIKRLHAQHEVHYVALDDAANPEGKQRSGEYSAASYGITHVAPERGSWRFAQQVAQGTFSSLPLAVSRFRSSAMRAKIAELEKKIGFDAMVCDFPMPAPNLPNLAPWVLFQHNVEYQLWQRRTQNAPTPLHRAYFSLQSKRMFEFERGVCRAVRRVIAVSQADAQRMEQEFGLRDVAVTPTGVDAEYFAPSPAAPSADLVFIGSMDWLPNEDGMLWFTREILPRIRAVRPGVTLSIVGRKPGPAIRALAGPGIEVTGTVPDVRPWMWGGQVSIVPLRIGGGTRLKIYEAMAAGLPVVSTTIGAEGLAGENHVHLRLEDDAERFAQACLDLLQQQTTRQAMADVARELVVKHYTWDVVVRQFGEFLRP